MMNKRYWLEKWKMRTCFNIPMEICNEFLHCDEGCMYAYDAEIIDREEEK